MLQECTNPWPKESDHEQRLKSQEFLLRTKITITKTKHKSPIYTYANIADNTDKLLDLKDKKCTLHRNIVCSC